MNRRNIIFLQLPQLDTCAHGHRENLQLAATYLRHAMEQSPEGPFHRVVTIPNADELDDRHLLAAIARAKPAVIAATLYLWNIERTLDLLKKARRILPKLKVVAGGPEVADDHPFLFRSRAVDVTVPGEGEKVFPSILKAFRTGRRYVRPAQVPAFHLQHDLPPPEYPDNKPDANGMAYIESTRGCPFRCSYCCYGHRRSAVSFLRAEEVLARVRILRQRGAKEIRFIDPMFNANPEFRRIIVELAKLNRSARLQFFAELQADRITAEDAKLLALAGFREIEVGVQSRNPETLRQIHRPDRLEPLDQGIQHMMKAGILLTVDLMYGLPGQNLRDIQHMLNWAARLRRARVQCMQTLLLPGTELRRYRHKYGFVSSNRPPYQVKSSATLTAAELRQADMTSQRLLGVLADAPTARFVGRKLPGLFTEHVEAGAPGRCSHRAMFFRGDDLYGRRRAIRAAVRRAVAEEPHILWQFVLVPEHEEPLDLLEELADELERFPPLVGDALIELHSPGRRTSRRIFVQLRSDRRYDRTWQQAAEELLRGRCF